MVAVMVEVESEAQKAIHAALLLWGKWANSTLAEVGWSRVNLIARIIEMGVMGAAHSAGIKRVESDETCELIDRAVRRLDETEQEVVIRTYCDPPRAAQVTAQQCGLTYHYYRQTLSRAQQRIGDYLDGARGANAH